MRRYLCTTYEWRWLWLCVPGEGEWEGDTWRKRKEINWISAFFFWCFLSFLADFFFGENFFMLIKFSRTSVCWLLIIMEWIWNWWIYSHDGVKGWWWEWILLRLIIFDEFMTYYLWWANVKEVELTDCKKIMIGLKNCFEKLLDWKLFEFSGRNFIPQVSRVQWKSFKSKFPFGSKIYLDS